MLKANNNKKILASVLIFIAGAVVVGSQLKSKQKLIGPSPPTPQTQTTPETKTRQSASYSLTAAQSGRVALDLLQTKEKVTTKDYGKMGRFITSINGLAGDDQHFWAFYLNGEQSQVGASQAELEKGDVIKFVYEEVK